MNLRHIDPRSTDWMDAMLEREPESAAKRESEGDKAEEGKSLLVAGPPPGSEPFGAHPRLAHR